MGQRVSATLAIGLELATGPAMRDLAEFGAGVDRQTANAIREFNRVDAAVKEATSMAAAGDQMTRYGQNVARTAADVQRDLNRIERSGESMASQLERQLSVFGKTTEEVRALKAETAAYAAETAKVPMLELATRIREAERALEAEERAVREAAFAHQMFEARVREGAAAMAAAEREAMAFEATVARVANRIDPSAAALARLRTELDEAKRAFDATRISAADFGAEQARIVGAVGRLYGPQRQVNGALDEGADASRRNGFAMRNLGQQFGDFATQVSLGSGVMRAFSSQAGQVGYALSEFEKGPLASVGRFLTGPWGIAFTVAAVAIGPLIEGLFKAGDASAALKEQQSTMAAALDRATGKVREQVGALALLSRAKAVDEELDAARARYNAQRVNVTGTVIRAFQPIETSDPLYGQQVQQTRLSLDTATQAQMMGFLNKYRTGLISVQKLNAVVADAAATNPALRGLAADMLKVATATETAARTGSALRVEQARIAIATGTATDAQRRFVAANTDQEVSTASLIEKQVALATATNAVTRAHAAYDLVRERGAAAEKAGGAALVQYQTDLTHAAQAVNAAETAAKAATQAQSAHRKEMTAAAKDARELDRALDDLQKKLDPHAAAEAAYRERVADIAKLAAAGRLDDGDAQKYRVEALRKWWDAEEEAERQAQAEMLANLSIGQSGQQELKLDFDPSAVIAEWLQFHGPLAEMNGVLERQARLWDEIGNRAAESASNMERSFGRVGSAIGGAMEVLAEYGKRQHDIDVAVARGTRTKPKASKRPQTSSFRP